MLEIKNTFVIDWLGPYFNIEDVKEDTNNNSSCFYIITGKTPYQRNDSEIKYIGITKREVCKRLSDKGHHIGEIKPETRQIWVGKFSVSRFRDSSKKDYKRLVETCLIRYMTENSSCQMLNTMQTVHNPKEPILIVNRWFNNNYIDPIPRLRKPSSISDMPDIIMFDGENYWSSYKLSQMKE